MPLQLTVLLTWVRIVSHQCLSFVTTMGDICQKCCFQAMERPLPKLKMKRSQHGLISRVHFSEFETTEITNTQDISEQEWKSSQESYLIPSAKSPISTAQVEFWIGQKTRSLIGRQFSKRNLIGWELASSEKLNWANSKHTTNHIFASRSSDQWK